MNSRRILLLSILLNLGLFAAAAHFATRKAPAPAASGAAQSALPAARKPASARAASEPASPVVVTESFHWRNVESEDYKRYIANLRAIGCPDETIRDIIIADVAKLYAQKLSTAARAKDFNYWQAGASRAKLAAENRRTARDLEREKWALLRDLLGPGAEAEFRKTAASAERVTDEATLAFLPEAKRNTVRELLDRYAEQEQELQMKGPAMTQKDRAELKKVRDARTAELARVLTPQELEDYDVRLSNTAESLRMRLANVQPTEEQFRQLFKAQKAFDDEARAGGFGPSQWEKSVAAQRALEDNYKKILGEPMYADYRKAQDPSWRGLLEVAKEQNLALDTVNKVYEMKKLVDENVRSVMGDPNLARENRMATLKTMGEQTEQAIVQLLGQQAWDAYKQNGGTWVPSAQGGRFMYQTLDGVGDNLRVRAIQMIDGAGGGVPAIFTSPDGAIGVGGGASQRVIVQPRTP